MLSQRFELYLNSCYNVTVQRSRGAADKSTQTEGSSGLSNMKTTKHSKKYMVITVGTAAIAAIILIAGTVLTGRSASLDTGTAVRNVSLLYLDELAGRREQVVASQIAGYITNMKAAVSLISDKDLESREALSEYQSRMKQYYGLDKFAFIGKNGTIYTSNGIRSDISQYPIDYRALTEPLITLKDTRGINRKVIIAMPVDRLPLGDDILTVCFIELDANTMLKGVSLQSDNNNTTFCNIYTREGRALTDMVLGGLASEDNLLSALENADFENGFSADRVREDFAEGRHGVVSFTYNDINETLCYEPIENTDWLLTYLIRESVISEQISSISEGIIKRSLILSLSTAGVLIIFFAVIIWQSRKAELATLEKEVQEAKSRAKTTFLSNMSHEIRTPITAVLGMNEMIQRESTDPNVLSYSDNIKTAGESLLGIINDILDFSKIETGHMEISEVPYKLPSLLSELYNLVHFRAEDKGLLLSFKVDTDLPRGLFGDELKLRQIITNLLTNAVKYTDMGSVTLTLEKKEVHDGRLLLYVSVSDTGIGIKREELGKLFHEFDRLDYGRNRNVEGTGLGLAITKRMLELMGSSLSVKSSYGEGSLFFFTLEQGISDASPVGEPDLDSLSLQTHSSIAGTPFTAPKARILITDDTPMNLQVIAGLLKRTEMQIDTASNGSECIEKFGKNTYDLVFIDYRMPGMDGVETLRLLMERYPDRCRRTPIVSLTASAVAGSREKMLAAGFSDFLTKPVDVATMENVIIRHLPAEKVSLKEAFPEPETQGSPALSALSFLDTKKGIDYCGDIQEYLETLSSYAKGMDERIEGIRNAFLANDREAFILHTHSLKSMSLAVGATELSQQAEALERAAVEGTFETSGKAAEELLSACGLLKAAITEALLKMSAPY